MGKNPVGTVLALSFVSATALLILNLQPQFIGSVGREFELSDVELGYFATWPLLASVVVFVSAPFWLYRFSMQTLIYFGGIVAVCALLAMTLTSTILPLTLCFMVYVIGISIIQVPALVALGQMPDPESAFGAYVAASVLLAGVLAFLIPAFVEPAFGFHGFLGLIAMTTIASIFCVHSLSDRPVQADEDSVGSKEATVWTPRIIVALVGLAIFYLGIMASWSFLERVGEQAGLEDGAALGLSFGLGLLFGALGPLAGAHFGDRISAPLAIMLTAAMFLGFILLLTVGNLDMVKFALALIAFNIAWNFGITYLLAVASKADSSGRGFALAPAAMSIGAAFGPALGGNALSAYGATGLFAAFGGVLAFAFMAMLWVDSQSKRHALKGQL
ncbi:MAG: hypothetical protein AAGJ84_14235 [Pseudomonadota bacterium]